MINEEALEALKQMIEDNLGEKVHVLMNEGQEMLESKQSTNDETLDGISEVISEHMQGIITKSPNAVKDPMAQYAITQSYLLLQILDRLERVEDEISKLNPDYK